MTILETFFSCFIYFPCLVLVFINRILPGDLFLSLYKQLLARFTSVCMCFSFITCHDPYGRNYLVFRYFADSPSCCWLDWDFQIVLLQYQSVLTYWSFPFSLFWNWINCLKFYLFFYCSNGRWIIFCLIFLIGLLVLYFFCTHTSGEYSFRK